MRVITCVKEKTNFPLPENAATDSLNIPAIGRADLSALEAALTIKSNVPKVEVIALNVGSSSGESALRYCLARGADAAWRLEVDNPSNSSHLTAAAIAQAVTMSGSSLVLCGALSNDWQSGIVPARLATSLNLPWISRVVTIEVIEENKSVVVMQKGERGARFEVKSNLPAVLSFDPGIQLYQYVSIRRLHEAENVPIQVFNIEELGLDSQNAKEFFSKIKIRLPKPRTKRSTMEISQSSGEDMMWQMISGSTKQAEDNLVRGDAHTLAQRIADLLKEKGVLK